MCVAGCIVEEVRGNTIFINADECRGFVIGLIAKAGLEKWVSDDASLSIKCEAQDYSAPRKSKEKRQG